MVVITTIQVLAMGANGAVAFVVIFYSFAVGVFAPMQFIFHNRVPARFEPLQLRRVNRTGLTLVVLLVIAVVGLAFQGGVRLG